MNLLILLTFYFIFGCEDNFVCSQEEEKSQKTVNDLLDEYFRWKLESSPLLGSANGYHEYDGELPKRSLEYFDGQKLKCEEFRTKSDNLLKDDRLTSSERHFINQILYDTTHCVESFKLKGYLLADISLMGGAQTYLPQAFSNSKYFDLSTRQGYENVLQRLEGIPTLLKDIQILLEMGIQENVTLPIESLINSRKQFEQLQVVDPQESIFFSHFKSIKYENATTEDTEELIDKAKMIITSKVLPSFKDLDTFIHYTYLYHVRNQAGILALPNGNTYYEECLKFFLTTSRFTPEQIHQIGLDEVKKLSKGVAEVGSLLGLVNMTSKEVFAHVNKEQDQYFEGTGALQYSRDLIETQITPILSEVFEPEIIDNDLIQVNVVSVPKGSSALAYYRLDTIYLNVRDRTLLKRFELMTLMLHEAVPGHHLHLGVANKILGFPDFLSTDLQILPWSMVPSMMPEYGAFIEGWALYCEFLGQELGLFEDPYDLLGFYSFNLLRAARLVVDTGIHHYGWTRDEVIEYLLETTAVSPSLAGQQADRYITWPGQATSYKLGEMVILSIRAKWEKELGDKFNLAKFHTYLLSCYGALDTVESCMNEKAKESQHEIKQGSEEKDNKKESNEEEDKNESKVEQDKKESEEDKKELGEDKKESEEDKKESEEDKKDSGQDIKESEEDKEESEEDKEESE